MKSWYSIKNLSPHTAEISIYDEIGMWGVTAADFARELKALGDATDLTLRINSPGGSVFDALAIYNTLRRHPATVTATVDGIAASAASVIAMAADKLVMPANSFLMIHDPSGLVMGTADDMREMSDVLDSIKTALVNTYHRKTKDSLTVADIAAMLSEETWLTAEEAVGFGLADEIEDAIQIAALCSLDRFKNAPQSLQPKSAPVAPPAAAPVALNATALAERFTTANAAHHLAGFLSRQPEPTPEQIDEELARIQALRDVCAAAHLDDDADAWIASGVQAHHMHLIATAIQSAIDQHIDTTPPGKQPDAPVYDFTKVYAKRRQNTLFSNV